MYEGRCKKAEAKPQFSTFKAAIEREKSDACISSSEREQARGAASIFNLKKP